MKKIIFNHSCTTAATCAYLGSSSAPVERCFLKKKTFVDISTANRSYVDEMIYVP